MFASTRAIWTAAAGLALCAFQPAFAEHNLSAQDKTFVEKAAKGGMHEVAMGKMGLEKGDSEAVKSFSQRLVNDHSKAGEELKALATQKGITLPAESKPSMASMLESKKGTEFDKAFRKAMIADHKKDIAEFEKQAKSGADAEIKGFAEKTLPTLREHLKEAESLPN